MKPNATLRHRARRGRRESTNFTPEGTKDAQRARKHLGLPTPEFVPVVSRVLGARWGGPFRRPAGLRDLCGQIGLSGVAEAGPWWR